jgi:A/G-specific adenine glycosylase
MRSDCVAYRTARVNILPVKEKRVTKRTRWFNYFVFSRGKELLIRKRDAKDIWHSLHEFYLVESESMISWTDSVLQRWMTDQLGITRYELLQVSPPYKQQLTHQTIHTQFICIKLAEVPDGLREMQKVRKAQLEKLAFPKSINTFLNEQSLYLL